MNSPKPASRPLIQYGGQAVLEGVMMRGRKVMAVAVRRPAPDGTIQVEIRPLGGIYRHWISRVPILRGILLLWDTFGLGMESMSISAGVQGEQSIGRGEWITTLMVSLLIAVGAFFLFPAALGQWIQNIFHAPAAIGNLLEGLIRVILVLGYLAAIGQIPEIARVFAYHGAEHKTVHAFEAGAELTPESVETFPCEHPRCGTSFLIVVLILATIVFTLFGPMPLWEKVVTRLAGIPLLVSIGYEYLRLNARVTNKTLSRILAAPGIWMQRLTTREPDRSMVEVAIAAFQAMRAAEGEEQT